MSHNIRYASYPEKVNKNAVQKDWDHYVRMEDWQEGASGLPNPIRWIENPVYRSREDAEEAISKLDKGWYDQLAVKYYENIPRKTDSKLKELEDARTEAMKEYDKRSTTVYPATLQANLITCKKCGSKLAKSYLKYNHCPLCSEDLRPDHILKSIAAAKAKYDRRIKEVEDYKKKHSNKNICWLVKIEYHT